MPPIPAAAPGVMVKHGALPMPSIATPSVQHCGHFHEYSPFGLPNTSGAPLGSSSTTTEPLSRPDTDIANSPPDPSSTAS
jgi:hypothetical protein